MQLGLPFGAIDPRDGTDITNAHVRPREALPEPHLEMYFVRHRRARRYIVRVEADGRVRVTIPRGGSRREADAFALEHVEWIRRQQRNRAVGAAARPPVAERRRLRELAADRLSARLLELAARHGLTVSRISIRDQRTRWGSCGRDGHICLNWRLVQMPDRVRDYVLTHELMHLRRLDHSPKYWKLVAAACPDYQEARRWLRAHGRRLM
jgi:predicted metal-dependent hydrolase